MSDHGSILGLPLSRAFRTVFTAPPGSKIPVFVHIVSAADDGHKLYVNGDLLAQSSSHRVPQASCALLNPGPNVFAFEGTNVMSAAGVLAKFQVTYSDGTTSTVVTDASWKASENLEQGFETLAFDDRKWGTAYVVNVYGKGGVLGNEYPAQAIPTCPKRKLGESSGWLAAIAYF